MGEGDWIENACDAISRETRETLLASVFPSSCCTMPLTFAIREKPSGRIFKISFGDGRKTRFDVFVDAICHQLNCDWSDLHLETVDSCYYKNVDVAYYYGTTFHLGRIRLHRYASEHHPEPGFQAWNKKVHTYEAERVTMAQRAIEEENKRMAAIAAADALTTINKVIDVARVQAKEHCRHVDLTSFTCELEGKSDDAPICLLWGIQARTSREHIILGDSSIQVRPLQVSKDGTAVTLGSSIVVSYRHAPPELVVAFDTHRKTCEARLDHARHLAEQKLPSSLAVSCARTTELHALVERNEQPPDMDLNEFGCLVLEQARIRREIASQRALIASLIAECALPIDASKFITRRARLGVHAPFGLHRAQEPSDVLICPLSTPCTSTPTPTGFFLCSFPTQDMLPLSLSLLDA
jgi:hypothetical protein